MQTRNIVRVAAGAGLALALSTGALADAQQVKVAKSEKAGSYLTDGKGMALYVFQKDPPGKSVCAGTCVAAWPLFSAEKVQVAAPLKASDFGTITRDDGQKQTTYKKMPLYYYAADMSPGDTSGHGFMQVWALAPP